MMPLSDPPKLQTAPRSKVTIRQQQTPESVQFQSPVAGSCSRPRVLLQIYPVTPKIFPFPRSAHTSPLPWNPFQWLWHTSTIAGIYWIWSCADLVQLPPLPLICCVILGEWLPLWTCLWHSQNINIHVKNLVHKMINSSQRGLYSALS